jgi:hypothetical protein
MEPHHPDQIDWKKLKNALKTGGTTRLYAFRAHLRGHMHFSPKTDLALRCWTDGVPCLGAADATLPGGWAYKPITREVVEEWVKDLYKTFAAVPMKAAG